MHRTHTPAHAHPPPLKHLYKAATTLIFSVLPSYTHVPCNPQGSSGLLYPHRVPFYKLIHFIIEQETLGRVWSDNSFKIIMCIANRLDPAVQRMQQWGTWSKPSPFSSVGSNELMNDYFSLYNTTGCQFRELLPQPPPTYTLSIISKSLQIKQKLIVLTYHWVLALSALSFYMLIILCLRILEAVYY